MGDPSASVGPNGKGLFCSSTPTLIYNLGSNTSNGFPIALLDGTGSGVGFPDNPSPFNSIPNIPNRPQGGNPDGPHDDTSTKNGATQGNAPNAGTPEDLNYDVSLKDDLNKAFNDIKAPGTFAAWGALPTTPPAGLNVDGVGDIAFPLQEETMRQLIAKSHQAPYGRRSETLVDVSVRNTWEINGDQLHFFDPDWVRYVLRLSHLVATTLGIKETIRLDLYKMLIYETEAMFKAHTDTEETPGMFGTLIICLPSAHTGGEVIVRHHGQTKTLRTSDATQSYASVKPGLARPIATAPDYQRDYLRKTLRVWLNELTGHQVESHLYCPFEHKYTEAAISLRALKKNDLARVHVMQDLTRELPFDIFLALLEKKDEGCAEDDEEEENYYSHKRSRYCYYDPPRKTNDDDTHVMTEIHDTTYAVKSLHALDGTTIAHEYDFDMESCLEEDPFLDLEIAEEDFEPYMGNSGPSATHWYRRATLVVVPHSELGNYLAKCASRNSRSAIGYLARVCSLPTVRAHTLDAMFKLCGPRSVQGLPPGAICDVLKVALQHSRDDLFKSLAGSHRGELPATFFDWAREWLNTLPESVRLERYQNWIPLLLFGYLSFADRISMIQRIARPTGYVAPLSNPLAQGFTQHSINNLINTPISRPIGEGAPTSHPSTQDLPRQTTNNFINTVVSPSTADIAPISIHLTQDLTRQSINNFINTVGTKVLIRTPQNPQHPTNPRIRSGCGTAFWKSGIRPDSSKGKTRTRAGYPPGLAADGQNPDPRRRIGTLVGTPTPEDGSAIVSAVFSLNDPWAETSAFLALIFDRFSQANLVTFLLQLLSQFKILANSTNAQFPVSDTMSLWKNLISRFCQRTPANIMTSANVMHSSGKQVAVTPQALVEFACDLNNFNTGTENLLEPFIKKISSHCTGFSAQDMRSFWMPFFYDLTWALASQSVPLNTAFYQQLTRRLIKRLDDQVLGPCPQPTPGCKGPMASSSGGVPRPQVSCRCGNCTTLNRFL
ncbi:hypothetical protein PCANC_11051 [Puccinia coronata f. sp. avenae]|uniref:Prolyl 4-hydroxylase alpha subunit Fe(2+) 2OG dioxygenase domain-containing protein n=1 Tax=Puccinia coronata f. sp. avenae TaxID=200324 RepID=A0A2N5UVV7_9BASI|nr:hypothetical protein PCANC_11051 [Puccinia coronata f. sp. avenae]